MGTAARLDGKVAIVTGAGRGVGAELARGLARAGAVLVLADADGPAGRRTVLEVNTGESGRAIFHPGHPAEPGFAAFLAGEAEACWGGLDILAGAADELAPLLEAAGPALARRGGAVLALGEVPAAPPGLRLHALPPDGWLPGGLAPAALSLLAEG